MKFDLIASLERWKEAGLLDPAQADRILAFEVTLPRKGPTRPIRLGVKRDGVIVPI